MTPVEVLVTWLALSAALAGLWVGAITLASGIDCLRRWSQPPDPEVEVLRELERLWQL